MKLPTANCQLPIARWAGASLFFASVAQTSKLPCRKDLLAYLLRRRGNDFSLSAFDRGREVKWGEGRGEVLRSTIFCSSSHLCYKATSKSAVSRVSKPACRPPIQHAWFLHALPPHHASRILAAPKPGEGRTHHLHRAFTLLEVMIAIAIFFVASFAILSLVGSSLDNVRRLQRPSVDASSVLARYAATNSLVEGPYRGSLGEPDLLGKDYRDYNYAVDIEEIRSNHLYSVRCVITPANGKRLVISDMFTVLYKPQSPPGSQDGGIGLTGH